MQFDGDPEEYEARHDATRSKQLWIRCIGHSKFARELACVAIARIEPPPDDDIAYVKCCGDHTAPNKPLTRHVDLHVLMFPLRGGCVRIENISGTARAASALGYWRRPVTAA